MGLPGGRITDTTFGTCTSHSPSPITTAGMILTGSGNVIINGLGAGRVGDLVLGFCGHVGIIVTGSGSVFSTSSGQARLTDSFVGAYTGTIISGSGNVFVG